jgi:hypothetical protein
MICLILLTAVASARTLSDRYSANTIGQPSFVRTSDHSTGVESDDQAGSNVFVKQRNVRQAIYAGRIQNYLNARTISVYDRYFTSRRINAPSIGGRSSNYAEDAG